MRENRRSSFFEVFRVAKRTVSGLASQKSAQRRFARRQWLVGEILIVQVQQIKNPVDKSILATVFQVGLQQRKTGNTVFALDHQFAVEQRRLCRKGGDRCGNAFEPMRPVQLLSREQTHLAVIEPRLDAVAVEFDFVNPARSVRGGAVQRGEAGRYEIRKSA